ncbi:hypothetical protein [Bosea sp. RAC05]|uniref:hypothetical protein n=1 Tax=Bosea sp. RAC05 TaxID=1842539 RepID=UPI00083E030D|nr:hypothetical protein [Bosea sp. RAC05]AOG02956.1 hypothetical protein BSY19_5165 [Bosea sp. RAC05]
MSTPLIVFIPSSVRDGSTEDFFAIAPAGMSEDQARTAAQSAIDHIKAGAAFNDPVFFDGDRVGGDLRGRLSELGFTLADAIETENWDAEDAGDAWDDDEGEER